MSRQFSTRLLIAFMLLAAIALSTPLHRLFGGDVEPTVLGVPFFIAWTVVWLLLAFCAMLVFHLTRKGSSS